ncbi:hypothetical protein [Prosthecomicrobium sp. N25]|uniref:hypothetical protein n=1 Tax=Prosthecomicrobium sp. N25 TaxID=3129254 RepID=UPI003076E615
MNKLVEPPKSGEVTTLEAILPPSPRVDILAKVVPAGLFRKKNGKSWLRAALVLTPVAEAQAGRGKVEIARWPDAIRSLRKLTLSLLPSPSPNDDEFRVGCGADGGHHVTIELKRGANPYSPDIDHLWRAVMGHGGLGWDKIVEALPRQSADQTTRITCTGQPDPTGAAPAAPEAPRPRVVTGVYPSGRNAAAYVYERRRADRIAAAARLTAAQRDAASPDAAELKRPGLDQLKGKTFGDLANGGAAGVAAVLPDIQTYAAERYAAKSSPPGKADPGCRPPAADGAGKSVPPKPSTEEMIARAHETEIAASTRSTDVPSSDAARQAAGARLYGLQTMPVLARLFGLVVDVEFEVPADLVSGADQFVDVCVSSLDGSSLTPRLWTLSKLRLDTGPDAIGDGVFLPAQREEFEAVCAGDALTEVSQFEGCVVLGQALDPGAAPGFEGARYAVSSLDVVSAMQAGIHQELAKAVRAEDDLQHGKATQPDLAAVAAGCALPPGSGFDDEAGPEMRTAGLALIDRMRHVHVVDQLAAADRQPSNPCDLRFDADELTIGYRVDVGAYGSGGALPQWRSLMNRKVDYIDPWNALRPGWLEAALSRIVPNAPDLSRSELDAAILSMAAREVTRKAGDNQEVNLFCEELVALWSGDPIGLECQDGTVPAALEGAAACRSPDLDGQVPISRRYDLPSSPSDPRPPRLRFGAAYRFGMRAVYVGGIAMATAEAARRYETAFGGRLTVPQPAGSTKPSPKSLPARRFLRHERIAAPTITMPPAAIETVEGGPSGQMELQTARDVVLRSLDTTDGLPKDMGRDDIAVPVRARRVLVAPAVPLTQALLHGVLDRHHDRDRAPDGLDGVRYSVQGGGFPVARRLMREVAGAQVVERVKVVDPKGRIEPGNPVDPSGDAVFDVMAGADHKLGPYYPDPAAHAMVIALKRPGPDATWLAPPLVVPLYRGKVSVTYPDVLPVVVDVEQRDPCACGEEARLLRPTYPLDRVGAWPTVWLDERERLRDRRPVGAAAAVRAVTVALAPGEDVELVAWCVPTAGMLESWFAAVESVAVLEAERTSAKPGTGPMLAGFTGALLPDQAARLRTAEAIRAGLLDRPLADLVSSARLRLTHAVNRPLAAPKIAREPIEPAARRLPVRLIRAALTCEELLKLVRATAESEPPEAALQAYRNGFVTRPLEDPTSATYLLGGSVEVDLATTASLEIRAYCASPHSGKFDDPARRRERADRIDGAWPSLPGERVGLFDEAFPAERHEPKPLKASKLFGFEVDRYDRVSLPRSWVTLMRISELPAFVSQVSGLTRIDLHAAHLKAIVAGGAPDAPTTEAIAAAARFDLCDLPEVLRPARVALPHRFPDLASREVRLVALAISRHAPLMRTRPRLVNGRFVAETPLPDRLQSAPDPGLRDVFDKPAAFVVDLDLPGLERPPAPAPQSSYPVFGWTAGEGDAPAAHGPRPAGTRLLGRWSTGRRASIRIPLARPFKVSGTHERIGIVVWPPDLFGAAAGAPLPPADTVPRRHLDERVALAELFDADIGPGGAFVTRIGADPVRPPASAVRAILPTPADFPDLLLGGRVDESRIVRSVDIPLPKGPKAAPRDAAFRAALVLHEPRFDVAEEHWYVDVTLARQPMADPFVRFGVVRYNPALPKDLRVSEPAVAWGIVAPERILAAELTECAGVRAVKASFGGRAPAFGAVDDRPRPTARFRLVRRETSPAGLPMIDTLIECDGAGDQTGVWTATLTLPPEPARPGARYFVQADEHESWRPARYPVEPVPDTGGGAPPPELDLRREAGPRFVAELEIAVPPGPPR